MAWSLKERRIIALALEMAGNEQRAAIWFKHQPIPGFAGSSCDGKADAVINYLAALRAGRYA